MRLNFIENDMMRGRRGEMVAVMLQNVIHQDIPMRGFPRKGNRPRKHWMETAFAHPFMDVDEGIIEVLRAMDSQPIPKRKKKKFRAFKKVKEKVVEVYRGWEVESSEAKARWAYDHFNQDRKGRVDPKNPDQWGA